MYWALGSFWTSKSKLIILSLLLGCLAWFTLVFLFALAGFSLVRSKTKHMGILYIFPRDHKPSKSCALLNSSQLI